MKKFHSLIFLIIICLSSASAIADDSSTKIISDPHLQRKLSTYLAKVRAEYDYYADIFNDGSLFPAEREQEILDNIEINFLKDNFYGIFNNDNPLTYVSSVAMAKLFTYYGGNVFDEIEKDNRIMANNVTPFISIAEQELPVTEYSASLRKKENHEQVLADIEWLGDTGGVLPSNNVIALAKLYLGLGVDIHDVAENYYCLAETFCDARIASVYAYDLELYRILKRPDKKHRADDIITPYVTGPSDETLQDESSDEYYYRSPVTYWLEEFIESDYPVSMLDTHRLHYPRFMKEASVAQVMDMLKNSYGYKISANINCPYKGKQGAGSEGDAPSVQASTELVAQAVSPAELCPLVPSVNMRDAMGRTPLHIAGEQGNKAVYDALIQIGADKSIKDYRGNLPHY